MKPVAILALVVSTAVLAFFVGRASVSGSCHTGRSTASVASLPPAAPPVPEQPADPTRGPALVGRVLELIQVPGYTYLRFEMPGGDRWAAVPTTTTVKIGDTVRLVDPIMMHGFNSPTLKRTFDSLYFAQLAP
jgi:hypothetical protein